MNKEVNYSDKILTVAGIKVLGNVENKAFQRVKDTVQNIQQSVNQVSRKAEDFWSNLSKDGIISRTEKKQLRKEYESIDQTHTALMNQAREKGVENTREVLEYDFSFQELHDYLFVTLKLFDDMSKDTPIESAEVFNSYYNDYSYKLQNAQSRVNIGDPGKIRTLTSLMDEGTDGEVALYENNFYRYDLQNHEWINIEVASSLGEYQGVLTSSPPMIPNQYFLVGPEGIVADTLLFDMEVRELEDNVWVDHNGEVIYINNGFEIGYIYYYDEQVKSFIKVEDKNNWRYILAMNDMIACNFSISPELYAYITQNVAADIEKRTEENVLQHIPKYLGKCNAVPGSPHNGDWMLWATTSTSRFTKSHLYLYQAATETWEELNPGSSDGKVQQMFMSALNDMLGMNDTDTEYFSTIFFDAFYGNQGSINHLNASQIDLQNGGYIQSVNYEEGKTGFKIDSSGHAEFNDIEISAGYATETELNNVKQTTNTLTANVETHTKYIADLRGTTKDLGDNLNELGDNLDEVEQTASDIITGQTALEGINGEILRDATDPDAWALRTQGFDPFTSKAGFGITKGGNVYANNGIFRGKVYAEGGEFSGVLNCGSLKVMDKPLYFLDFTYTSSEANPNRIINYFYKYKGLGVIEVNLENEISKFHITANAKRIDNQESINIDLYVTTFRFEQIISDKTEFYYLYIDETYSVYVSGYAVRSIETYRGDVMKLALMFDNLPISKPTEPNIVWNDNGTLKLS